MRERQSALDRALGQLQYQRELSRLQLLHIQVLTSGLGRVAHGAGFGLEILPPWGNQEDEMNAAVAPSINQICSQPTFSYNFSVLTHWADLGKARDS